MDTQNKFVLCIDTIFSEWEPSLFDGEGNPILYDTEKEAQLEWLDDIETRIEAFKRGHMDFDAIFTDEFILPVTVHPDGTLETEIGTLWEPKNKNDKKTDNN